MASESRKQTIYDALRNQVSARLVRAMDIADADIESPRAYHSFQYFRAFSSDSNRNFTCNSSLVIGPIEVGSTLAIGMTRGHADHYFVGTSVPRRLRGGHVIYFTAQGDLGHRMIAILQ